MAEEEVAVTAGGVALVGEELVVENVEDEAGVMAFGEGGDDGDVFFGGVVAGAAVAFILVTLPDKSRTQGSKNSLSQGAALVALMAAACVVVPQLVGN